MPGFNWTRRPGSLSCLPTLFLCFSVLSCLPWAVSRVRISWGFLFFCAGDIDFERDSKTWSRNKVKGVLLNCAEELVNRWNLQPKEMLKAVSLKLFWKASKIGYLSTDWVFFGFVLGIFHSSVTHHVFYCTFSSSYITLVVVCQEAKWNTLAVIAILQPNKSPEKIVLARLIARWSPSL